MKFEIPRINIAIFETEDIITTSGGSLITDEQKIEAVNLKTKAKMNVSTTNVFEFVF